MSQSDVVYLVRPGDDNEELRYSLRSLEQNFKPSVVAIVGHTPKWVTGVRRIDGNSAGNPHANVYQNVQIACWDNSLTDEIIIMNDDFYFTEPVDEIPSWYRETLDEHLANNYVRLHGGWWKESLELTKTCLQSYLIAEPLSYELHVPVKINRRCMAEVLERFALVNPENPPQWRTLYGNMKDIPATKHSDVKAYGRSDVTKPFMSSEDGSWIRSGKAIREMFPNKSKYEV